MQPMYPICDTNIVLDIAIRPVSERLYLPHRPISCRILVTFSSKWLVNLYPSTLAAPHLHGVLVLVTGNKFIAGVVVTGDKVIAGVVDTGDKH